jgi:hypothetical protein
MKDDSRLIQLMTDFVSNGIRATLPVREIEGEFAALYDDDERFTDLRDALAMYDGTEENHRVLIAECKWALKVLAGTTP